MGELKECAICGAAYANGIKHQRFHDEIEELMERMRAELSEPAGAAVGAATPAPEDQDPSSPGSRVSLSSAASSTASGLNAQGSVSPSTHRSVWSV